MQTANQQKPTETKKQSREEFFLIFKDEKSATARMKLKNRAYRAAGNFKDIACKIEHPDGWVVCDLRAAIATEMPYEFAA